MLSDFIHTARGRGRHLATPCGPYLDGYLAQLSSQGFAAATLRNHLKEVTAFGEYLVHTSKQDLHEVGEVDVEHFVEWYCGTPRSRGPHREPGVISGAVKESLRGTLRRLFAYLHQVGSIRAPGPEPAGPFDQLLDEYVEFLAVHRGFAANTMAIHRLWGRRFFSQLAASEPPVVLEQLTNEPIERVFMALASRPLGKRSRQIMTSCIEAIVQYLRGSGRVPSSCAPFLPRQRGYALAALPSVIGREAIERVLRSVDRRTAMGRRDYAMLLLLATYGLRASEVVGLSLDDIDWRSDALRIRQRKTRRVLHLPLLSNVREALVAYLRAGRPRTSSRAVFLTCHAPIGPLTRTVLYGVTRRALCRAGVHTTQYGPHLFRHSHASYLVRQGHSLKVVGDLLGHRVPEATLLYCKLAVEDLRRVALEVPGAQP